MFQKPRTHRHLFSVINLLLVYFWAFGCGNSSNSTTSTTTSSTQTGSAFVIGTDAPIASVVSFNVQIQSIDAVDASNNSASLVSGTPTVDFARFNGLQTLLDLNSVPADTYTSVVITLGPATIGYLQTQAGAAPSIQTKNASLSQTTITIPLSSPLVVTTGEPVGLRLDFDLHKSIQVDANGNVTGTVTPTFNLKAVTPTDPGAFIDEFDGAVLSVDAQGQSFQIQGPHGRQFTVNVNGQTEFDGGGSLGDLTTNSIVQISGNIDRADSTINADEVAILSQDGFYAGGQITYVQPSSGPATNFDLYVRGLLPTTTGLTLGQIAQVNLTGNENYFIYWMRNPLTQYLFNSSVLVPGQHVAIGGPASGAANPQAVTVKRVVLRHWGYNGTVVANSVDTAAGSFQMNVTGFAGQLVPGVVTVYTGGVTQFRNGLTGIDDLGASTNVRVVGLLIKDQSSRQLVLLAHYVDPLD